jgi:hypothetical protein
MNRLPSVTIGLICFIAAGVAAYFGRLPAEPPTPSGLFADEPVLQFGAVHQGDTRDAQFRLVNRHPEAVEILDVLTGCSCLEAKPSARQVPPGGRFTVDVKWQIGPRRGRLADPVRVSYRTAAGGLHLAELILAADVVADVNYSPAELSFDPNTPGSAVVRFTPGQRDRFVLRQATVTQAAFRAELMTDRAEVVVTFDPGRWIDIGPDAWLTVETDNPVEATIRIPLRVTRAAAPQAMPSGGS